MRTKLCLWLALSLTVLCVCLAVVLAALGAVTGAIWSAAAAAFFAFVSAVLTGDLERWREANRNDRDWRIHPRL
jgi:hypothetical protein